MKISKKFPWLIAIALAVIILLTILFAPSNNNLNSGSTYNKNPDGYGAWYAFMANRGTPIQRWQKPFQNLTKTKPENSTTLLQINSYLTGFYLDTIEKKWVEKGNKLIILGIRQPVTEAAFSSLHSSLVGNVKIDTTRRKILIKDEQEKLGDKFGAIVWEEKIGQGKLIFATTPYLAANAYQKEQGNYEFLAQLVTQDRKNNNQSIFIDEYIHGYKDKNLLDKEEKIESLLKYFGKTPLINLVLPAIILFILLVWAENQRFGQPAKLKTPVVDNSEAYIQALAAVLEKAGSNEFILDLVGKEEQLQLQKALGLGTKPLNQKILVDAWVQQTKRPAREIQQVLKTQAKISPKNRISDRELLIWLQQWQTIRQHLPF